MYSRKQNMTTIDAKEMQSFCQYFTIYSMVINETHFYYFKYFSRHSTINAFYFRQSLVQTVRVKIEFLLFDRNWVEILLSNEWILSSIYYKSFITWWKPFQTLDPILRLIELKDQVLYDLCHQFIPLLTLN